MNKHNIIEFHDYKINKFQSQFDSSCFSMLDKAAHRIKEMTLYVKNFNQYIDIMVREGHTNESFAENLRQQVDMMIKIAIAEIELK